MEIGTARPACLFLWTRGSSSLPAFNSLKQTNKEIGEVWRGWRGQAEDWQGIINCWDQETVQVRLFFLSLPPEKNEHCHFSLSKSFWSCYKGHPHPPPLSWWTLVARVHCLARASPCICSCLWVMWLKKLIFLYILFVKTIYAMLPWLRGSFGLEMTFGVFSVCARAINSVSPVARGPSWAQHPRGGLTVLCTRGQSLP